MNGARRAPIWQRWLAAGVLAVILFASPPIWASIALTSAAIGLMLAGSAVARQGRARAVKEQLSGAAVVLGAEGGSGTPVVLTERQLQAHAVIMGASGSGKSTTLLKILTDQILQGTGVVAIDLKGSPAFAAELARAARAAERPFQIFSPDGPALWNPLAHGNATELKDKVISMERFSEIHYQRAAERYLQLVLQLLKLAGAEERAPTLHDVVELMDPSRLEGLLRAAPPESARHVREYLSALTPDQLSAIRGLATRLAIIDESHTGRYLGGPAHALAGAGAPAPSGAVDLRAALRGEQVVLFSLNSSSYGKLSAQLGALAIQDLIAAVGERTRDPSLRRPALVAVDEFSGLQGDHILGLNVRCREAGVGCLNATQEPTDYERAAGGLLNQILGSTAIKIIHRLDVPSSAEMMAKLAGTETVWEHSRQYEQHPLFGNRETGRATAREVERFIVHPNVIKSLPTGQAVVITRVPETRVRVVAIAAVRPSVGGVTRVDGRAAAVTLGSPQRRPPSPRQAQRPGRQRQVAAPHRDGPELG